MSEQGQGTSWEESKINSSTKKTKTGQWPFLKLEYTETSVGAHEKTASKKTLAKQIDLGRRLPSLYTQWGGAALCFSFPFNLFFQGKSFFPINGSSKQ